MIKTNIKMRVTPEQSTKVQEICFANGVYWADTGAVLQKASELYISTKIFNGVFNSFFNDAFEYEEVDPDLFIRTNGSCKDECAICGESKDICPNEETCSYRIEYKDTKNDFMEDKLKKSKHKNNFQEFGFNAEFEGEIKFKSLEDTLFGEIKGFPYFWLKNGECYRIENIEQNVRMSIYDLTPIKKEWYKDQENFKKYKNKLIINKFGIVRKIQYVDVYKVATAEQNMYHDILNAEEWRLLTKEEALKLIIDE